MGDTETITYRLQVLLLLPVERPGLDGDDLGRRVRVVCNGRAALAAEDAVDGVARGAGAGPALGWARDGHLVLLEDGDEGCGLLDLLRPRSVSRVGGRGGVEGRGGWGRGEREEKGGGRRGSQ